MPTKPQKDNEQKTEPFDLEGFMAVLSRIVSQHLGGDGRLELQAEWSGNINLIYKFGYQGRSLGARVTVNRRHFRYEKDIVKEVFAVLLLYHGGRRLDDSLLRAVVDGVLSSPKGSHVAHAAVRPIVYYDWSMTEFAYPFFLFEWIEGDALWERSNPALYAEAGKLLAMVHRHRFENFYEDIFAIKRNPRPWAEHLITQTERELAQARTLGLDPALCDHLAEGTKGIASLTPGLPCLVHNDYSGGNLLIDAHGALRIIDWDNWVVDCPELDIVKMKHWTAVGPEHLLAHDSNLFQAFLKAYDDAAENPLDPGRLAAYERLWLLRTFNFEQGREISGAAPIAHGWQAVYPRAAKYAALLAAL